MGKDQTRDQHNKQNREGYLIFDHLRTRTGQVDSRNDSRMNEIMNHPICPDQSDYGTQQVRGAGAGGVVWCGVGGLDGK